MANSVLTRDTVQPGIWLSHTRNQMLLSGATLGNGGTDDTWHAGELLLAALNTCATSLLRSAALEQGWRLEGVSILAESERDANQPDRYSRLHIHFDLKGVSQSEGEALLEYFKSNCPIYGTVSRGGPTTVSLAIS